MVKILVDSTNDIMPDMLEKLGVEVIPLYVNFDEDTYKDGVDITTPNLYKEVEKRKKLPKTAAATVGDFLEVFQKYIDNGDEIVFTGISKEMSSTYNNAIIAAKEVAEDKIFVVDSKNLSTGIGLLILKACKDRDNGLSAKEIAERMKKNTDLVLSQFAIESMEYLYKGGRCSSLSKIIGSMLRIKPIIQVREGKMSVQQKPIGKMKRALDKMLEQIIKDKDRLDPDHIFLTHSIAPESRDYLLPLLKENFPNVDIIETVAGCVVSSHCGPGTIGILYMIKDN